MKIAQLVFKSSMLLSLILCLVVAARGNETASFSQDQDKAQSESKLLDRMIGVWIAEKVVINGQEVASMKGYEAEVKKDSVTLRIGGAEQRSSMVLDESKSPVQMTTEGSTGKGNAIVKFDEEVLLICVSLDKSGGFPTDFECKAESNTMLVRYRKKK